MGVYELHPLSSPGMHWQQDRQQMLAAAYDPSRDLSPNLPCQESSNSSGCSSGSSSSGGSTCCKSEFTSCGDCGSPGGAGGGSIVGIGSSVGVGNVIGGGVDVKPPIKPCLADHREPVVCAGCNMRIIDRYYLFAVDRRWHAACLQCSQCRLPLDREVTCFARDGSIFCKKDYYRLFGMKRCARCQAAILSSELVMRARELVFHVHCFSCAVCSLLLTKGDTFGMRDGSVFCRVHYSELPPLSPYHSHHHPPPLPTGGPTGILGHPSQPPPPPSSSAGGQQPPPPPTSLSHSPSSHTPQSQIPPPPDGGVPPHFPHQSEFHPRLGPGPPVGPSTPQLPPTSNSDSVKMANSFFNGAPAPRQKGRPRKRKPKDLEGMTANLDLNAESYLDVAFGPGTPGLGGANGSHHQRTKRMRTSFKHHQLRTMKSYFAINHNPDAKDLKQLSQKTGLPKRVLQVWFQNARAKWRRMVLKQEGGGGGGKDKEPGSGLENYHHSMGQHGSPQHYLSSSPLECSN